MLEKAKIYNIQVHLHLPSVAKYYIIRTNIPIVYKLKLGHVAFNCIECVIIFENFHKSIIEILKTKNFSKLQNEYHKNYGSFENFKSCIAKF